MIFGDYFFKRKIHKLINDSRSRKHQFCSLEDADNILILYRHEDKMAVEPGLEKLRLMNKRICCCVTYSGLINNDDSSTIYLNTSKDSDKYGIPNKEISDRLAKVPADILIDLSRGKCHTLKALMLQHPARFKVGERLSADSDYDFAIIMTDGGGITDLFDYLLFYLQTIRSK